MLGRVSGRAAAHGRLLDGAAVNSVWGVLFHPFFLVLVSAAIVGAFFGLVAYDAHLGRAVAHDERRRKGGFN